MSVYPDSEDDQIDPVDAAPEADFQSAPEPVERQPKFARPAYRAAPVAGSRGNRAPVGSNYSGGNSIYDGLNKINAENAYADRENARLDASDERARQVADAANSKAEASWNKKNAAAQLEDKMIQQGLDYYKGEDGQLRPKRDEAGNVLYKQGDWAKAQQADGSWAHQRRGKNGQAETKRATVTSKDDNDPNLYYDFGADGREVAGHVDDLVGAKDPELALAATKHRSKWAAETRKAAMKPLTDQVLGMEQERDAVTVQSGDIANQQAALGARRAELQVKQDELKAAGKWSQGFLSGGGLTSDAEVIKAQNDQLDAQDAELGQKSATLNDPWSTKKDMVGPKATQLASLKAEHEAWQSEAKLNAYADVADERRAVLKKLGRSEKDDPILNEIGKVQEQFGARTSGQVAAAAEAKRQSDNPFNATLGDMADPYIVASPEERSKFEIRSKAKASLARTQAEMAKPDVPVTFGGEMARRATDMVSSFGAGSNSLLKMAGDLYGVVTGDFDNVASEFGKHGVEYFNEMKSPELAAAEKARSAEINSKTGVFDQALAWVSSTFSNPELAINAFAEQVPNTVGSGGAGALIGKGGAALVLRNVTGAAAAKMAARVAVATQVGTNALLQGADVAGDQHEEMVASLGKMPDADAMAIPEIGAAVKAGHSLEEAKLALALSLARKTFFAAAGASAVMQGLPQFIPGLPTLEKTLAGGVGVKGIAKGAARTGVAMITEGGTEMGEEGVGLAAKNKLAQKVDPTREVTKGLGETLAQSLVVGAAGGGLTALDAQPVPPVVERGSVNRSKVATMLNGEDANKIAGLFGGREVILKAVAAYNAAPTDEAQAGNVEALALRMEQAQKAQAQIAAIPDFAPDFKADEDSNVVAAESLKVKSANRDAASALVKLTNGVRAELLTEGEQQGLQLVGEKIGTGMVEVIDGVPVITDKAATWLKDSAPAASALIGRSEGEMRAALAERATAAEAAKPAAPAAAAPVAPVAPAAVAPVAEAPVAPAGAAAPVENKLTLTPADQSGPVAPARVLKAFARLDSALTGSKVSDGARVVMAKQTAARVNRMLSVFKPIFGDVAIHDGANNSGGYTVSADGKLNVWLGDITHNQNAEGLVSDERLATLFSEEAAHVVSLKLAARGKWNPGEAWGKLSGEEQALFSQAYLRDQSGKPTTQAADGSQNVQMAHEMVRMFVQGRAQFSQDGKIIVDGKTTEQTASRGLLEVLKDVFSKIQAFLSGEAGKTDSAGVQEMRAVADRIGATLQQALGAENFAYGEARSTAANTLSEKQTTTSDRPAADGGAVATSAPISEPASEVAAPVAPAPVAEAPAAPEVQPAPVAEEKPVAVTPPVAEPVAAPAPATIPQVSDVPATPVSVDKPISEPSKVAAPVNSTTGGAKDGESGPRSALDVVGDKLTDEGRAALAAEVGVDSDQIGDVDTVIDNDGTYKSAYMVVEAAQFPTSHTIDGAIDANYPQNEGLQPRDRSTPEALQQQRQIAINPNLEMDMVGGGFSTGVPTIAIVEKRDTPGASFPVILTGHGRKLGRETMYSARELAKTADKFRTDLAAAVQQKGIDPAVVARFKNPILVRTLLTPISRAKLVILSQDSNKFSGMETNAEEQAKQDAGRMTPTVMAFLAGGFDIDADRNLPFRQEFVRTVLRSSMVNIKVGDLSRRIKAAIFSKAYSGSGAGVSAFSRLVDENDDGVKSLIGAMLEVSPKVASFADDIVREEVHPLNVFDNISIAVESIAHTLQEKPSSMKVSVAMDGLLAQDMMPGIIEDVPFQTSILRFLVANRGNMGKLTKAFEAYINLARAEGSPRQESMFGAMEPRSTAQLWNDAVSLSGDQVLASTRASAAGRINARLDLDSLVNKVGTNFKPKSGSVELTRLPDGSLLTNAGSHLMSTRAYHGTPHKVDKFSMDKIGTGEGAQAYGWGLYFAEDSRVADSYRSALSGRDKIVPDESAISKYRDEFDKAVEEHQALLSRELYPDSEDSEKLMGAIDKVHAKMVDDMVSRKPHLASGVLYTVELLPDADAFLDWDKPLSEQSEKVKAALGKASRFTQHERTTLPIRNVLEILGTAKEASEKLLSAGIPGIRYLDGASRDSKSGTSNYVIFDESLVKILEENGSAIEGGNTALSSGRAGSSNVAKLRTSISALEGMALEQSSWRDWYGRFEADLVSYFGEDSELFKRLLGATSQAAAVKSNVGLALKAYEQFKLGEPFTGYLEAVSRNLDRIRADQAVRGPKISAYSSATQGGEDAIAIDRHIARLLFRRDVPNQAQIEKGSRIIRMIAAKLGWAPREVQASLWAANIYRQGQIPQSYDAYLAKLKANGTLDQRIARARGEGGQDQGEGGNQSLGARAGREVGVLASGRARRGGDETMDMFGELGLTDSVKTYAESLPAAVKESAAEIVKQVAKDIPALQGNLAAAKEIAKVAAPDLFATEEVDSESDDEVQSAKPVEAKETEQDEDSTEDDDWAKEKAQELEGNNPDVEASEVDDGGRATEVQPLDQDEIRAHEAKYTEKHGTDDKLQPEQLFEKYRPAAERMAATRFSNIPGVNKAELMQQARLILWEVITGVSATTQKAGNAKWSDYIGVVGKQGTTRTFWQHAGNMLRRRMATMFTENVKLVSGKVSIDAGKAGATGETGNGGYSFDDSNEGGGTIGDYLEANNESDNTEVKEVRANSMKSAAETLKSALAIMDEKQVKAIMIVMDHNDKGVYGGKLKKVMNALGLNSEQSADNMIKRAFKNLKEILEDRGYDITDVVLASGRAGGNTAESDTFLTPDEQAIIDKLTEILGDTVPASLKEIQANQGFETDGTRTQGRPDLANPGQDEASRNLFNAIDEARKATATVQNQDDVRKEAARIIATDRVGTLRAMLDKASKGESFDNAIEGEISRQLVRDLVSKGAMGNEQARKQAQILGVAYRAAGTEGAREMAMRKDTGKTPAERIKDFITGAIWRVNPKARKSIEGAWTKAEQLRAVDKLKAEIAKLQAKTVLVSPVAPEAAADNAQLIRLRAQLGAAMEKATKESLELAAINAKIKNVLTAMPGVTLDHIINGEAYFQLIGKKFGENATDRVKDKGYIDGRKISAIKARIQKGQSDAFIAKGLGIDEATVAKVSNDLREEVIAGLMSLGDEHLSDPSKFNMDDESGELKSGTAGKLSPEERRKLAETIAARMGFGTEAERKLRTQKGVARNERKAKEQKKQALTPMPEGAVPGSVQAPATNGKAGTLENDAANARKVPGAPPSPATNGKAGSLENDAANARKAPGSVSVPVTNGKAGALRNDAADSRKAPGSVQAPVTNGAEGTLENDAADSIKTPGATPAYPSDATGKTPVENGNKQLGLGEDAEQMPPVFDPANVHDAVSVARAIQAADSNKFDMLYEAWINGILSGPMTQAANVTGNAFNAGWELGPKRFGEALVNLAVRDKNAPQMGEFKWMMMGLQPAFAKAWKDAVSSFDTEVSNFGLDTLEEQLVIPEVFDKSGGIRQSIPGKTGRVVRIPGRLLMAADAFFKTSIAHLHVATEAYRAGMAQGLKSEALAKFIETESVFGSASWGKATALATELTFQEDHDGTAMGELLKGITNLREWDAGKGIRPLRFIAPFIRTPFNIFQQGIRQSPAGSIMLAARIGNGLYSVNKGKAFAEGYPTPLAIKHSVEQVMAWAIVGALYGAAAGDDDDADKKILITGSITDKRSGVSQLNQRAGMDAYVMRIGGAQIKYGRIEPLATMLGTAIDMITALKGGNGAFDSFGNFLASAGAAADEKTFLRGWTELSNALSGETKLKGYVAQQIATVVPNLFKQPIRNLDPVVRQRGTGFLDTLAASVYSPAANPKIGVYGKEIEKAGAAPARLTIPAEMRTVPDISRVDKLLLNYNAGLTPEERKRDGWAPEEPSRKFKVNGKPVELGRDDYEKYSRNTGEIAMRLLASASLNVSKPTKRDIDKIKTAFGMARAQARRQFFGAGAVEE